MSSWLWLALALASLPGSQGPCLAVHYGRPGHAGEVSMEHVARVRVCPGRECIQGFEPRTDVAGYIAVRYADRWRIGQNWRALVTFKLPWGGYSAPLWLQPVDYQAPWDVRSAQCRVETSASLASRQGWSIWQGWGTTRAYIEEWQK